MSHTYVVLDVSPATYQEVYDKLKAAGYERSFHSAELDSHDVIDMHGIALRGEAPSKTRDGDQPLPTTSDSPRMHDLLTSDIQERMRTGISRYGRALQAHNGRDGLLDMYQEMLDAAVYCRQLLYERDGK